MSKYCTTDFDYEFPREAIAQHPLPDRASSRLLALDRESGSVRHISFRDLPTLIDPGDVLVLNTSRVLPARLTGERDNGRPAEILLIHEEADGSWLAMVHPGGKLKIGRVVRFGSDATATVVDVIGGGIRRIAIDGPVRPRELMDRYGSVPLPPYIHRPADSEDVERYQTVYAEQEGSIAAPTAGLHFTKDILSQIAARPVSIVEVVLHVGPGTFKPVTVEDPADHVMHREWYEVPPATADLINSAKAEERRIWAVGTTVVRALESAASESGGERLVVDGSGWTNLFIRPPYDFSIVDALLTNFHLPRSTLLMLVAAFAGHERTMEAYREALREGYRLYSYGDAMVVL